jgi:hypothetical protein
MSGFSGIEILISGLQPQRYRIELPSFQVGFTKVSELTTEQAGNRVGDRGYASCAKRFNLQCSRSLR